MAADLDLTDKSNQPGYLYDVHLPESDPGAVTAGLAGVGAGNVDNGVHRYKVTLITAEGETAAGTVSDPVTVADKTADGKVALSNIPTGTSGRCTARKIYRTEAGGSDYKLLTTLADNSTTTYTDNTADADLSAAAPAANTTGIFYVLVPAHHDVTLAHTGLTTAGAESATTDSVVVMQSSATMARNTNAGAKTLLRANGSAKERARHFLPGTDGDHELQLAAIGAGGKVQFVVARNVA